MQAYMIRLSINEDLKLRKGKGKNRSTTRSYIQSSGHATALCHHVTAICRYRNGQVLPFSASAVTIWRGSNLGSGQGLGGGFFAVLLGGTLY